MSKLQFQSRPIRLITSSTETSPLPQKEVPCPGADSIHYSRPVFLFHHNSGQIPVFHHEHTQIRIHHENLRNGELPKYPLPEHVGQSEPIFGCDNCSIPSRRIDPPRGPSISSAVTPVLNEHFLHRRRSNLCEMMISIRTQDQKTVFQNP